MTCFLTQSPIVNQLGLTLVNLLYKGTFYLQTNKACNREAVSPTFAIRTSPKMTLTKSSWLKYAHGRVADMKVRDKS